MRWMVEWDARGFLVVRTYGRFDVDDHARMVRDIVARADWRPGADVLFDHRQLDFGETGLDALRAALGTHREHDDEIGDGRAAILMDEGADFGIGRQFAAIAEDRVSAKLRVFRDAASAEGWLAGGAAA